MIKRDTAFIKAVPIWAKEKTDEINCSLYFETSIESNDKTILRIAGNNDYQVFINGIFCFYGPARAGRGYYRVDEIAIGEYLTKKENQIEILVSAYNIDNFCFLNEKGFVCVEFVCGEKVFGETGSDSWSVREYTQKIRKTQRYSFQRPFAEVYDYRKSNEKRYLSVQKCEDKKFIVREVPYPAFDREYINEIIHTGVANRIEPEEYFHDRAIDKVGNGYIGGFAVNELDICSVWEAQKFSLSPSDTKINLLPQKLFSGSYMRSAMLGERTGFIELDLVCKKDADIYLTFDEILSYDGKLDFTRLGCSNVVVYKLCGGQNYHLVTSQPYSLKYIDVICLDGEIELNRIGMIRLDFDKKNINKKLKDDTDADMRSIYDAAVETFRQNTVDIYMDCPSRERAGWLCDSFFTSRVEYLLTGKSAVEHAFLANFAMEDDYYKNIPDGMLPMCYPSEHAEEVFIPNWSMWYVLELNEYLTRTGDMEFVNEIKDKMYRLIEYFKRFENSDGLLEKLQSWVFIEWSRSNDLIQDINYPSNMLYYAFLNTIGKLYEDKSLIKKAETLKSTIREKCRCGVFFCDNSVYQNGVAILSGECTESCQYYAFFTGVADIDTDSELWNILVNDFGSKRKQTDKYPEIAFSNAFIGNYLRCELLMRNGLKEQLEKDIRGYFLGMAKHTGTLWEHDSVMASCNHGFASHVLMWLDYLNYLQ